MLLTFGIKHNRDGIDLMVLAVGACGIHVQMHCLGANPFLFIKMCFSLTLWEGNL